MILVMLWLYLLQRILYHSHKPFFLLCITVQSICCLSIYLFDASQSIFLSILLSIYLSVVFSSIRCLSIYMFNLSIVYLIICCLSIYLLSIHLSTYCLSIYLHIVYPTIYTFIFVIKEIYIFFTFYK